MNDKEKKYTTGENLAPRLEVAAGYSRELKTNVVALCYTTRGDVVAVVAIHSKADSKDHTNAARLAHCWNTHDDLVAALEAQERLSQKLESGYPMTATETMEMVKGAEILRRSALAKARGEEVEG